MASSSHIFNDLPRGELDGGCSVGKADTVENDVAHSLTNFRSLSLRDHRPEISNCGGA